MTEPSQPSSPRVIPTQYLAPFILVTFLFSLWGFANDITNPMVAAFKNILLISNFQSSLVQFAFYGGYCFMAFPAALFIKRYSYKTGILIGLALYAIGCLLFIPSGWSMQFSAFLISYFIMTCGLSFLETSSNPYILAMGPEETSTQRLNFAQSFNPMGSLSGMFVAMTVILANLNPMTETGRRTLEQMSQGQTCHQQVIEATAGALAKAQTATAEANSDLLQNSVTEARNQLIRITPEWARKSDQATQLLNNAQDKEALAAAREEVRKIFQGQDAFTNLRTGEMARGALDQAALAYQEFEQSSHALKPALIKVRMETQAVFDILTPLAASGRQSESALKQAIAETLPVLKQASEALKSIDASALRPVFNDADQRLQKISKADLDVIIGPYTVLGIVVVVVLVIFIFSKLPRTQGEEDTALNLGPTLKRLFRNPRYLEGVVTQAFYVGAQIMCWTFIIQYAESELGMPKPEAQKYNIIAMAIFVSSRFICTFLLKYISPGGLLMNLAMGGFALVAGTIFIKGMTGLYCLVGVSACMSLMFPTIYGIALRGLGDDAKLGAAGLIMAIGGGCLMPPMQGAIMDMDMFNLGFMTLSSARASFVLPLICFVVIAIYGFRTSTFHQHTQHGQ